MGLLGKIIKTAVVVAAGTTVAKKIKEKINESKENKLSIETKDCKYIKVCDIAEEYVGENYRVAQKALIAYGFKNVNLIAKKDLKRKRKVVDGYVETISFNGETEFNNRSKFSTNAHVVITYHTYIDAEDENETPWATAKCQNCGATFKYNVKNPICSYCGTPIDLKVNIK
ncbi:MAG: hypothetical protein IJX16_01365 [Clostridia bacterium]|nr:hypothetical protein [Clostridia bacterium]